MTVSSPPSYRNNRPNYYTDKASDMMPIGSVVSTFKAITSSYDNSYTPVTRYTVQTGNANTATNPEFQYPGYLYCDGAEYNIGDFPALFEVIGTDYGGEARPGIKIVNGGSGYDAGTTITFDSAPAGGEDIEANLAIVSGVVVGVNLTALGSGYSEDISQEPGFTLANTGGGSGLQLEINIGQGGAVESVSTDNVYYHWGGARSLGTFKVPDLKTRKILGYGNVYGPGSPTAGLITLGAGADKVGGSWYFDKQSQKGFFALGTITTTGYEKVTDVVETTMIGSQAIKITIDDRRLQGPPEHSHFIYHSTPNSQSSYGSAYTGDRYSVGYTPSNARTYGWTPQGGIAFGHKHGLSKQPLQDTNVATYDIFDYQMGAEGTGSIKSTNPDYYFASSASGAGTWEEVTYTPDPLFRYFVNDSEIGGRETVSGGRAIISYTQDLEYTVSQNINIPNQWAIMEVTLAGGGGSGSAGEQQGNDGNDTTITVTSGASTVLTITGGGGQGGGKFNNFTSGGNKGSTSVTGSAAGDGNIVSEQGVDGTDGGLGPGTGGIYPGNTNPTDPGLGGNGGKFLIANWNYASGTDGKHTFNGNAGGNSQVFNITPSMGLQTYNVSTLSASGKFTKIEIDMAGAKGANSQLAHQDGGGAFDGSIGGDGRNGCRMQLEIKPSLVENTNSFAFTAQAGYKGQDYALNAWPEGNGVGGGGPGGAGFSNAFGGNGGDGATDDGGGGGAASIFKVGQTLVAGAGGGGGGGGLQQGSAPYNGGNGEPNATYGDNPSSTSFVLYTGSGDPGKQYGCVGGGGGGGGGGVAPTAGGGGGTGGIGGDPQGLGGASGHGGGEGGTSGASAYKSDVVDFVNSSISNSGDGYVKVTLTEEDAYWSPGGGGGGSGGLITYQIEADKLPGVSSVALNMNSSAAAGVGGTDNALPPYAKVGFGVITGWDGGNVSISIGDIIIKASDGVNLFASGTGSGDGGGFKLPYTQVPEVEFEGGGGQGAQASVTITDGCVSAITLDNAGTGYTSAPYVRIKHGAGTKAYATVKAKTDGNRELYDLALSTTGLTPVKYNDDVGKPAYVRFAGTEAVRWIIIKEADTSDVKRFVVKCARGNGLNGGKLPNEGGDELKLFYNTDMSETFNNFLGVLVPTPSPTDISTQYDGSGTGDEATKWYWYGIDLTTDAQNANVRFMIKQERPSSASGSDDDNYGICDFIYEKKEITELKFIPTAGRISASGVDELTYNVEGPANSTYTTGSTGNDATFTLTPQVPLVPDAAIDPDIHVPLVESYHLCKHIIKAF